MLRHCANLGGRTQFAPTVVKPTLQCNYRDVEDAVPYDVCQRLQLRHLPLHKGGKGKCKDLARFICLSFLSLRLLLRKATSLVRGRLKQLKARRLLTGEQSSPLMLLNLHFGFAHGTPRTSSPTIGYRLFCCSINNILLLATARQSSVAPRQLLSKGAHNFKLTAIVASLEKEVARRSRDGGLIFAQQKQVRQLSITTISYA